MRHDVERRRRNVERRRHDVKRRKRTVEKQWLSSRISPKLSGK